MPTSQPATSSPRGNGTAWVRLRPIGSSAGGVGCVGLGCLLFGVFFGGAAFATMVATGSAPVVIGVLIGLVIFGMGGWQVMAAIGPRPQLWADPTKVEVGESFRLRWETSSRFKEASSIRITWEGREVAVERGYDSIFHRSSFLTRLVTSDIGPLAGTASVVLPPLTMPSFAARNALIEWRLRAEVETRTWPNVQEEFAITVLPSRVQSR